MNVKWACAYMHTCMMASRGSMAFEMPKNFASSRTPADRISHTKMSTEKTLACTCNCLLQTLWIGRRGKRGRRRRGGREEEGREGKEGGRRR